MLEEILSKCHFVKTPELCVLIVIPKIPESMPKIRKRFDLGSTLNVINYKQNNVVDEFKML